jgi:hypothetical protein
MLKDTLSYVDVSELCRALLVGGLLVNNVPGKQFTVRTA